MFRITLITAILLITLMSIFCSNNPTSSVNGDKVILYFDQSVTIGPDKIRVGFDSLLSESRCPDNGLILCFWQGMAEIRLWAYKPGFDTAYIALGIEGLTDYPEQDMFPAVDTFGLSFELIKLDPYPHDPENMAPQSAYIATLKIGVAHSNAGLNGEVRIVDIEPSVLMLDQYELTGAEVDNDVLKLLVRYGGGCKKHYFFAYMSPDAFMESDPVQANIYLQHYANGDVCYAYLADSLKFDLTPVMQLYREHYSPGGEIILNVYDYFEDTPGNKISVSYIIDYPPD